MLVGNNPEIIINKKLKSTLFDGDNNDEEHKICI